MDNQLPKEENLIKEQLQSGPAPKRPIPKMVILLGIVMLFLAALFVIFLALRNEKIKEVTNQQSQSLPEGQILFASPSAILDSDDTGSTDILISTGGNVVGGVVIAIKYDPLLLTDVKLENIKDPTSAISQTLVPVGEVTYDTTNGTALMTLELPPTEPMSGKGVVARLYYTRTTLNVAVDTTDITFIPITNFITVKEGLIPLNRNQITVSF